MPINLTISADSVQEFDQSFDRFALSADELWAVVLDALKQGGK